MDLLLSKLKGRERERERVRERERERGGGLTIAVLAQLSGGLGTG